MVYYIYKVTNLINSKYYLGKRCFKGESISDDKYLGSGTLLKLALKKYGKENFKKEIITICLSNEELSRVEREIITEDIINDNNSYNLALGGWGGNLGDIVNKKLKMVCESDEYRKKMSEIINSPEVKERIISSIKKTMSDIGWKEKFSKTQKYVQNQEENKIRNSKNQKLAQNKPDVIKKKKEFMREFYDNPNTKIKHTIACQTEGFRRKQREKLLGTKLMCNKLDNIQRYVKGCDVETYVNNGWVIGCIICNSVEQYDENGILINTWSSVKEASESLNINEDKIRRYCRLNNYKNKLGIMYKK